MARRANRLIAVALIAVAVLAGPGTKARPGDSLWIPTLPVQQEVFTNVSLFSDGTGYVSNSGAEIFLWRTIDFGLTRRPVKAPALEGTATIRFGSGAVGYALLGDTVYRTVDAGAKWVKLAGPRVAGDHVALEGIGVAPGGNTVVLGGEISHDFYGAPYASAVFVSDDRGASWRRTDVALKGYVGKFSFYDARHFAMLGTEFRAHNGFYESFRNAVLATGDGGATIREVLSCVQKAPHFGCTSVGMASPSRIVAGWADGGTSLSEDGGATFRSGQRLDGLIEPRGKLSGVFWVTGIAFATPTVGYASTNGSGVWRTMDGGRTWKMELAPQAVYGVGIPELAVGDADHAVAGGPTVVAARNVP